MINKKKQEKEKRKDDKEGVGGKNQKVADKEKEIEV